MFTSPFQLMTWNALNGRWGPSQKIPIDSRECLCVAQTYDLTGGDIDLILSSALTGDKREHIWRAAENHADKLHPPQHPANHAPAAQAVPRAEPPNPEWTYINSVTLVGKL